MKKETEQKADIDYADRVVPEEGKKGFVTMFMIMLGLPSSPQVCGQVSSWQQDWISGDS